MKIALPDYDQTAIGGGWSFTRNFRKALADNISGYDEADILFIPGASMVQRDEVAKAKADGKKVVLRVDNILRNSRNRNTGMTRMRDMAQMADVVVYQSLFAARLLQPYLEPKNSTIILNSVDQDVYNRFGRVSPALGSTYLYSKYSSDETKNWEMARSAFQHLALYDKRLNLVGRFDDKLIEYGFDLYQDEVVKYWGLIQEPNTMAEIYRNSDYLLYSYFNDACSNTLIEAVSCGLDIVDCYGMLETGGAPEIIGVADTPDFFGLPRMAADYREALAKL